MPIIWRARGPAPVSSPPSMYSPPPSMYPARDAAAWLGSPGKPRSAVAERAALGWLISVWRRVGTDLRLISAFGEPAGRFTGTFVIHDGRCQVALQWG